MNVVIIEDESLMAEVLKEEIENLGKDMKVVQCLDSVEAALSYFKTHELPDLFFSDIQLPDGLSFEIFQQLKTTIPVIFCTAYDEYALEAFKVNGIDYLLKPFDRSALQKTLEKYKTLTNKPSTSFDSEKLLTYFGLHDPHQNSSLLVFSGEKIIPIKKNHIALVYKKNGITYLQTFDQKSYVLEQNLDELEQDLGDDFFRANRQFLVHREAVKEVVRYFARKLLLKLHFKFEQQIIVSKAKSSLFLAWLKQR
ncbi:MAG: LytTR family DNA-binding domain-containing protein [Bacteroidota bacterium]